MKTNGSAYRSPTFGFPVPYAQIVSFDHSKALIIKRLDGEIDFSKNTIKRLPTEDMYQALEVA